MPRPTLAPLWTPVDMAGWRIDSLNLDHRSVTTHVWHDMDAGIDVYYDRRWRVTERFCRFLLAEPHWVTDQSVLIIGAGIGLETVVIGKLSQYLYLNDHAPNALELCAKQLRRNGIHDFTCLSGRYEELELPPVDIVVGCFVVYNRETRQTMRALLSQCPPPVLLMNDPMPDFTSLVRDSTRPVRVLSSPEEAPCVVFESFN